ncbi:MULTISPECIES: acyltransferase domain-containing protein [Burkholderia]|uniref:acyltransferase domain-containing protein n=1 Tax=Burkholderia TaxID=32008 RepID=UPI0008418920|nr:MULTISPECIES: acyltransferase domain-containing protein [unclassified Burkholderia]AOK31167.1 acyl transferase [Burkholderia sp. Bp7605]
MMQAAFLFPGQGAFYAGATQALSRAYPAVKQSMQAIDAVAVRRLRRSLLTALGDERLDIGQWLQHAPDLLQLALYATSVSFFEALRAGGARPAVLVGHSFGEIAALACGGAFSVETGAEMVCDRIDSLRMMAPSDGRMAAVSAAPQAVRELVAACFGDSLDAQPGRVSIAVENHSAQTVVSGAHRHVETFIAYCAQKNISAQILNSPYAFHHKDLENARVEFGKRLKSYKTGPLEYPVYSPILNRYYAGADDLGACLADHLVLPVQFAQAVARLKASGVGVLVECGALNALSKIAIRVVGPGGVKTFPGAASVRDELGAVENVLAYFDKESRTMNDDIRASNLQPDFDEFWRVSGPGIVDKIKGELKRFFDAHAHRGLQATPAPQIVTDLRVAPAAPAAFAAVAPAAFAPVEPAAFAPAAPAAYAPAAPAAPAASAAFAPATHVEPHAAFAPVAQAAAPSYVPATPAAPVAPAAPAGVARVPRDRLFNELVAIYAEAMEYPVEVFTETVELEAELGIDSVKQTEIIQRISARYGLPPLPSNFRAGDFKTMGQIVDFVYEHQHKAALVAG